MPRCISEVDPTVAAVIFKRVFINKFFGEVGDLDVDIFWLVQGGVEIEAFEIKGDKASIALGEYTVDEEFDKFK